MAENQQTLKYSIDNIINMRTQCVI